MVREFFNDLRRYTWGTAIWNLRFSLGYRIGGFTLARRSH